MTDGGIRGASFIGLIVVLSIAASLRVCAAERGYSFASTPGQLPKAVVPTHYAIELNPDFKKLTLTGSETIDIQVKQQTARLVLNAVNMTIGAATIDGDTDETATVEFDAAAETATLVFPSPIATGIHKLRLRFNAHINEFASGLFSIDYATSGVSKRIIATQLEPAEARRIFPCWDEPAFKATFALTVTVPQPYLVVSNMPVAREAPIGNGTKRVSFASTPRMSSYLFVLVAGELERLDAEADGVAISVVATIGKSRYGRYALDSAIELLRYYNDYFGVKYALPKLDLIALPDGIDSSMENWGGITFFENRLLFDPSASPPEARRGIFTLLAHEMAHQWFGNLVTMAWWNDLWLNEGFATWMQSKAAEHIHPHWQVWLDDNEAKQQAMRADALRTTRPLEQRVTDETEAAANFDAITYRKGQALVRMLEDYLGEGTFRAGIQRYMREHAYSNTTTADLWRALEAVSRKPIASIAASYTEQGGLPLIVAQSTCTGAEQRIMLRQERFTIHDPEAKSQRWQVPITLGPVRPTASAEMALLRDEAMAIKAGRCGEAVKLNLGDVGYFRVRYDAPMLVALAGSIGAMTSADRVNLLADTWALVESGRAHPALFFELVGKIGTDGNRTVWEQVIRTFGRIDHLQRGRPGRPAFAAYAKARLRPVFDLLGWDASPGEPDDRTLMRARLIRTLGDLGDEEIVSEARRRFVAFLAEPASLPLDLRGAVIHLAGRAADRATYETLRELGRKTMNADERVRYYSALAAALDPRLAQQTLAIALTRELPDNLVGDLFYWVGRDGEHADLVLAFLKKNFSALAAKLGYDFRHYFVSNFMMMFADPARAAELARFRPVHATAGGRLAAARARESIITDADFIVRQLPKIDAWVERHAAR